MKIATRMIPMLAVVACIWTTGCEQREPDVFSQPEGSASQDRARPGAHEEGPGETNPGANSASGSVRAEPSVAERSRAASGDANTNSDPRINPNAAPEMPAQWEVPGHWQDYALASEMRLGNWRLPAVSEDGNEGECAVFQFAGGGDAEANIRRWLGQFKTEDGGPSQENARRAELIIDSVPTFLVRSSGTYETQIPPMTGETVILENYGLFGVVFATATPVFIKCTGPEAVIEREADAITAFVRSFDFPG